MFKRYISPGLVIVLLFICPETFSQSNNVCAKDDLASEFALGRFSDANMSITAADNGELALKNNPPDEDFNTGSIPSGWNGDVWTSGGAVDFSGGIARVNGFRIFTVEKYFMGASIEFSANYTEGNFQNIGFAKNGNFDPYWLAVGRGGTGSADPNLYVRTSDGISVSLGANLLNAFHHYRISWGDTNFKVYVDEVLAATVVKTYTTDLSFLISDYNYDSHFLYLDWIRSETVSHPSIADYLSRVFQLTNTTQSLRVNWNATLPENTNVEVWVSSGNTPIPDASWTGFTEVSNNGLISSNEYLQYRVRLNSVAGIFTPLLNDISFSCSDEPIPPNNTPPLISNIQINANLNGTSTISWITDRNSDSRIEYGVSAESLTSSINNSILTTYHVLTITSLSQGTTYFVRVSSTDAENQTAISPLTSTSPLSFNVPVYTSGCVKNDLISDFQQSAYLWGNTQAVKFSNGELSLKPFITEEQFNSSSVPAEWFLNPWKTNGTSAFSNSMATLNGTFLHSQRLLKPGSSIEFSARFTLGNFQNIGITQNADFNGGFWLVIGRGATGSDPNLYLRPREGVNISLGKNLLDRFHEFRIDWKTDRFMVYVDGVLNTTIEKTFTDAMMPIISDYDVDGAAISVDWIRFTENFYSNTGVYQSKEFDLGPAPANATVRWNATLPHNTGVTILVKTGTENNFVPVTNGQVITLGTSSLQYQAVLSTKNINVTPLLNDISFDCGEATPVDITPPIITIGQVFISNGGNASISWSTDEPSFGQLYYGSDPQHLSASSDDHLFGKSHTAGMSGLIEGVIYYYRISATNAANLSSQLPSNQPLQFIYPFVSNVCAQDESPQNFALGEMVQNTEIRLNPPFGLSGSVVLKKTDNSITENFNSNGYPLGWNSVPWSSDGVASNIYDVANLDGARLYTTEKYLHGTVISFSAKFTLGDFENIGFAKNGAFDPYWIVIGRGQMGADPGLYVRTSDGVNILLGSTLLDAFHTYQIEWGTDRFTISVDGIIKTVMKTIVDPMVLQISDYIPDGTALLVDWFKIGLPSYPSFGEYNSRIFSLGSNHDSAIISWNMGYGNSLLSANTDIQMSVRSGNSATPDNSWTAFSSVSSYDVLKPVGAYLQYKAVLVSKDLRSTPQLNQVSFTCSNTKPVNGKLFTAVGGQPLILSTAQTFSLQQNRPNPFNNNTVITYSVPKSVRVMLTIYNLQGSVVKIVEDVHRSPGKYTVNVDTRNMGKGVYIYRIQAGEFSDVKKMIVE